VQLTSAWLAGGSFAGVGETTGRGGNSVLPGFACSLGSGVGLAGVLWQAARNTNNIIERVIIFFTIRFSFHNQSFKPPNFTNETDK
jgi:hypothetical protein